MSKEKSLAYKLGFSAGKNASDALVDNVTAIGDALKANPTPATYKAMRADWIKGYMAGYGCTEKRAENAWAETWRHVEQAFNMKKPQSTAAAAKQAQRMKNAPAKPAKTTPPTDGDVAAKAVKVELSAIEAHIVSLWKRGKFADIIQICQSEAEKQAPM